MKHKNSFSYLTSLSLTLTCSAVSLHTREEAGPKKPPEFSLHITRKRKVMTTLIGMYGYA